MTGMFDFLFASPYEERKIARYENKSLIISTARMNDSPAYAETAISHPEYNDGKWIIVENYECLEDAKKGYKRWVKIMTSENLPDKLVDVSCANINDLIRLFSKDSDFVYPRKKIKEKKGVKNEGSKKRSVRS